MDVSILLPETSRTEQHTPQTKRNQKINQTPSWEQIKNLFITCKKIEGSRVHDPSKNVLEYSRLGSCGFMYRLRDVVHGNRRVVHGADNSPESSISGGTENVLLGTKTGSSTRSSSSTRSKGIGAHALSSKGMQLRKFSGCYECSVIGDPSRYPYPRTSLSACTECGELFTKTDSLELHRALRHAVSEVGPEDSSRNIIEIIFKSSWLKKDASICNIERILKVHNTERTIRRFEACRDSVKACGGKKNPRCAADGNELLRFHCTTLTCALGASGSSSLCGSIPGCGVCTIVSHGFPRTAPDCKGVRTTATSGRAHDFLDSRGGRRAMLVCRVIAGRVKLVADEEPAGPEEDSVSAGIYDSVAGCTGIYSNLEELFVFNPRAILPCFVVIYDVLD